MPRLTHHISVIVARLGIYIGMYAVDMNIIQEFSRPLLYKKDSQLLCNPAKNPAYYRVNRLKGIIYGLKWLSLLQIIWLSGCIDS